MADEIFEKRNWRIYFEWIDGKEYDQLATEFHLSHDTIKEICTSRVPPKVRQTPWQTANSYRKFREWQRKLRQEKSRQA